MSVLGLDLPTSEINMNKKKTEGQIEMFDILNDIEDCPATLLSAKRHLITKCDSKLLIQTVHEGKVIAIDKLDRYLFTLLLFSDILVVSVTWIAYSLSTYRLHFQLIATRFARKEQ